MLGDSSKFSLGSADLYSTRPSGRLAVWPSPPRNNSIKTAMDLFGRHPLLENMTNSTHDNRKTNVIHRPFIIVNPDLQPDGVTKSSFSFSDRPGTGGLFGHVPGLRRLLRCKSRDLSVGLQNPVGFRLLSAALPCFADVQRFARRHERHCISDPLGACRLP